MVFLGDVHGEWEQMRGSLQGFQGKPIIQVGDLGLGFPMDKFRTADPEDLGPGFRFIRGNHDNPETCRRHKNYLGDFGMLDGGIMFLSGAWSIDQYHRVPGFTWWEEEELSLPALNDFLGMYQEKKPRVMVTHDCTYSAYKYVGVQYPRGNRTAQALQAAFTSGHQPDIWVFEHHHKDVSFKLGATQFYCDGELSTLELEL